MTFVPKLSVIICMCVIFSRKNTATSNFHFSIPCCMNFRSSIHLGMCSICCTRSRTVVAPCPTSILNSQAAGMKTVNPARPNTCWILVWMCIRWNLSLVCCAWTPTFLSFNKCIFRPEFNRYWDSLGLKFSLLQLEKAKLRLAMEQQPCCCEDSKSSRFSTAYKRKKIS